MASAILHIKDSYYFEVPKFLWRSTREDRESFEPFWIKLDPDYQHWHASKIVDALQSSGLELPEKGELITAYEEWKANDHHRFGKPFADYLLTREDVQTQIESTPELAERIETAAAETGSKEAYITETPPWSDAKIDGYNEALHGKVIIYQPFGELKNLYEPGSGFLISKFMIIEVVVALILCGGFIWLANRFKSGAIAPRGRLQNMLEAVLLFMRDEVARPAIGAKDAGRFVPLLWTIFLFILGCNLFGMIPWAGAPTGAFAVTLAMALVTFFTGVAFGVIKFGPLGYLANQIPSMDLPLVLAIFLKPMIFAIEVVGLLIKHGVLGVRLLANMVAGHIVLLGIMMLAFSLEGASSSSWYITAPIAVIGSTLFSCLELFVAFLQAYIFTFLSALFIGAAIHHH